MSEYTRDAGMITRYEIQCQTMSCRHAHYFGTTNKRVCVYESRRSGWRYINGAWYCEECANEMRPK